MKRNTIHYLTCVMMILAFSSCRQDGPAPIRNIKAGPNLLKAQAGASCTTYSFSSKQEQKLLGNVYTKQVLVSFKQGLSAEQEQQTLERYGFVGGVKSRVATNKGQLFGLELTDGLSCSQVELALQELAKDPNIASAAPCFLDGENLVSLSNDALITVEARGGRKM